MQLNQLKTFVAIAETGSFYAAAEKMCITQSAVSMQMKNLEEQLQLELFERAVRPPRISNTGLLLLSKAREIVKLSDELLDSSPVAGQFSGSIRIGTIPGASFVLPETLAGLRDSYRQLQVRVFSALTDRLVSQVIQNRLDAAIITQPTELDPRLEYRTIINEPLVVLAAAHQAGMGDEELLRKNHFISFNRKAQVSLIIEDALRRRNIQVEPIMELDTLDTFQMMILRGLGVGILPVSSVRKHYAEKFHVVPFGSPAEQRKVTLTYLKETHRRQFMDTFHDALSHVARNSVRETGIAEL